MRLAAALFLALAAPASAACLDATSIDAGISFTRADGRQGVAQRVNKATVVIDYAAGSTTAWTDRRNTRLGIYPERWIYTPTDEVYVGGGPGAAYDFALSGKPPFPAPGTEWATTIRRTATEDTGLERGPEVTRDRIKARYAYLAEIEVRLSGCTYRAIPVEVWTTAAPATLLHRYMFFPDLGFGLETRLTDPETGREVKVGLTAMRPGG